MNPPAAMALLEIPVPADADRERLDRFLVRALTDRGDARSRGELQRWIAHGRVRIDARVNDDAATKVHAGSCIVVEPEAPPPTSAIPEAGIVFDVLYMDADIVVLDKPAGLVVHPARGHTSGTLVNGLLGRGLFTCDTMDGPMMDARPGIVHRLDKGTSGVMVVARTPHAREALKVQFAAHTIVRVYDAICVGDVRPRTISTLHGRHPHDRLRFSSRVERGKRAVTHVRVLRRVMGGAATHVECTLETGRTHQIRMHLAESGTPIVGDALYGKPVRDARLRALGEELGHPALHARVLGFSHPRDGRAMHFEAPIPDDVQRLLGERPSATA